MSKVPKAGKTSNSKESKRKQKRSSEYERTLGLERGDLKGLKEGKEGKERKERGPLEPKLGKEARKALAARLREHLRLAPHDMGTMAAVLDVEPEVVVVALRELRARKRGKLRSMIQLGHVSWWWEDGGEGEKPKKEAKAPKEGEGAEAEEEVAIWRRPGRCACLARPGRRP